MRIDYSKLCFVVMPFGKKAVGSLEVDFDRIYDVIFEPAINAVSLPEGGQLKACRTDKDFFSGDISNEMFSYLEYSRVVLADISGLNANVFYEIGIRHRAHESGTIIFRQANGAIPFDINHIKAFPYEYEPEAQVAESKATIARVIAESVRMNRIDSPVQITLKAQSGDPPKVQQLLVDGENAIRDGKLDAAIGDLARASALVPGNALIRVKLGLLLKDKGLWDEALVHFQAATAALVDYADAWRERGIAENKLYWKANRDPAYPSGEESLLKAVAYHPNDYDALASLGGVLKRENRVNDALDAYRRARVVSGGNSYPLLNELKLLAQTAKKLELSDYQTMLARVEPSLRAQAFNPSGAFNSPWSFFDLSEVRLYQGDERDFLSVLEEGLLKCTARWQPKTHRESLEELLEVTPPIAGLTSALGKLAVREQELPTE
jgi:tetratricopeptide (TPR) repeat protein